MSVIRWEDPPAAHAGYNWLSVAHELVVVQLKRRPGEWAVIAESPRNTGMAHQISKGLLRAYRPAGCYEAVARNHDGIYTIYARYVGDVIEVTP